MSAGLAEVLAGHRLHTRGCTCRGWRTKQADAALGVVSAALGVRDE